MWDTVGSLGIPVPEPRWLAAGVNLVNRRWAFHDTALSSWVKGAFHALAIDEQRAPFRPTLWHQQPDAAYKGPELTQADDNDQVLKQVWFTGVHCDIGGGYEETALSDITLLWMVDQARNYGLKFDDTALSEFGPRVMTPDESMDFRVNPHVMGTLHDSRTGLYRLARPVPRPIGEAKDKDGRPDGRECLSKTAKQRHDRDTSYGPPGIDRYLEQPEVCLEQVLRPIPGAD